MVIVISTTDVNVTQTTASTAGYDNNTHASSTYASSTDAPTYTPARQYIQVTTASSSRTQSFAKEIAEMIKNLIEKFYSEYPETIIPQLITKQVRKIYFIYSRIANQIRGPPQFFYKKILTERVT